MFKDKEKFGRIFEIAVAILLGITAVLTAYASWQASLYGGNQATKYAKGTALIGEGASMYNEALQNLNRDMQVYDDINNMRIDYTYATEKGEDLEAERLEWKLEEMMLNNLSQELSDAMDWAEAMTGETGEYYSPFDSEALIESYYADANAVYNDGHAMIEDGQNDNRLGDVLNMTTVVYAVVLFLLGVVNTFESDKLKFAIGLLSLAAMVYALITMLSVPMLTL